MASFSERIVSGLSYFTFGIFGLIWIVYVHVVKKPMTRFATFNVFQSFMLSVIFAIFGILYDLVIKKLGSIIGILGNIVSIFDQFFNKTPIYFGYSITGLIITIFILYLIIFSLLGKRPFIPFVSDTIETILGA